jgi:3-isopropylmalate/(R)-2-methylmalate dehydratase small subunit
VAAFTTHLGKIVVYPDHDVDTDRIIPARFLSRISRFGYGELLFADVRGPEFALDLPEAAGATVLVVGPNFGCGSSREHAVWVLQQAGFVAVVGCRTSDSAAFSDIFRQNAANCGLLLVELAEEDHTRIANLGSGSSVTVDLANQLIYSENVSVSFTISPATKFALLEGLDLIGTTLRHEEAISRYETAHPEIAIAGLA